MLSLQTLTTIESLLMSRSDPRWGEFMVLAQVIAEVQQAKQAWVQSRAQPAQPGAADAAPTLRVVPAGPSEPPTPPGHKEVG